MYRTERKQKRTGGILAGLLITVACFGCLLCLLTLLLQNGKISEALLRLLLPLSCLLAGAAGVLVPSGKKEERILPRLLSGTVPSGCLLCCGLLLGGSGTDRLSLWNAAAFLLPALAALLPADRKSRHKRR